jgi:hypothetical protein
LTKLAVLNRTGRNIAVSGTCIVEGGNARFGLTLHNAMLDYAPVVWEFVINIGTMSGSGMYKWLTDGEPEGSLTVTPASMDAAPANWAEIGAR